MAARQVFLLLLLAAAAHAGSTAPTEALFTFDTDSPPLEGIPVVAHPRGKLVFTGAVSATIAPAPRSVAPRSGAVLRP